MLVPIAPSIDLPDSQKLLVKLKIQLKYDGISQANFLKILINSYLDRDSRVLDIFKENLNYMSSRKKAKKDDILTKKTINDFNLNEEEVEDMFDIIARENPDL